MRRVSCAFLVGVFVLGGCMTTERMDQLDPNWYPGPAWTGRILTGMVIGRVIDASTGLGLADVRIQVLNVEPPASATTDGTGAFVLPVVPQGKQIVVAEKAGFTAPPGALIADVMPNTTIAMGAFAMHPVAASPSPTPRQWLRARLSEVRGVNADTSAFDTERLDGEGVVLPQDQRAQPAPASPTTTPRPGEPNLNGIWTFGLPDGTQTPIPACGTTYRQFVFEDPDLDGRDVTIRVRDVVPPGSGASGAVSWLLTGGLVGDHYEFTGAMPMTGADGRPTTVREFFRLTYDAATGRLVGNRQVGPSVAEGGRGALPVELVRALFEAPPPEGCPAPSAPPGEKESP